MRWEDLDKFTKAYIEAALWSSTDDNDEPLDSNYDQFDLAPETLEKIAADCKAFQDQNADWLAEEFCLTAYPVDSQAGHDFWLTRNGHGCGFWEASDWHPAAGFALTDSAHSFGEVYLYVGDDGQLYQG